jgi:FkbM family methyltransferase
MKLVAKNPSPHLSFSSFCQSITDASVIWQNRKEELQKLIDTKPLLLFGYGGKGRMLAHQIRQITGKQVTVFDNSSSKREEAQNDGFDTIHQFINDDCARWATILGACQAQFEQKSTADQNFIYYQEGANLFGAPHLANLAGDFESFIPDHLNSLYKIYSSLHPSSQERFLQVLRFRVSSDPEHLQMVRQPVTEMWLDIPTEFKKRAYGSFLDVGAFDGDTLRSFNQRFGCERGIAVEANSSLFESIQKVATLYRRGIDLMPKAAWSKPARLIFNEVRFGMVQVTENVDGQLDAAPIDNYIKEPVDFLKMDIEGAESQALAGCREILHKFRPDLAIAAYHRPQDLVDLHTQIVDEGYDDRDFTWHLGHYSDCLDDSIFYVTRNF